MDLKEKEKLTQIDKREPVTTIFEK